MNKQELIDKLKKQLTAPSEIDDTGFNKFYDLAINYAIYLAEQLDEPKRPAVPRYVADLYESIKDDFEDKVYDLCVQFNFDESELNRDVAGWFDNSKNKPIETLVLMHKFGYKVEKEKLYTARLKLISVKSTAILIERKMKKDYSFLIQMDLLMCIKHILRKQNLKN
ncbi:DUF1642 domain-containing protein [Streptococcus lutetiensis]|uniref:DUF1642 domain-containing protein n=1 Tax=Streptococcus lutetiensis TaxID=150055 RepID=UPI00356290EE